MRIVYNSGSTGLTGTVGYRIVNADGTEYAARTTAGITESPIGTYSAQVADATLAGRTVEWDNGIGTVGASESFPASISHVENILRWFTNRRTVTATTQTLYADDGTTPLFTQAISDNGTTAERGDAA